MEATKWNTWLTHTRVFLKGVQNYDIFLEYNKILFLFQILKLKKLETNKDLEKLKKNRLFVPIH